MSPPETTEAGPHPETGPAQNIPTQRHQPTGTAQEERELPVFAGTALRPIGDAKFARVKVPHDCGFVHLHILFEVGASSIVRSPQCAPHREYRVVITAVVPAVQQRSTRGAA